MVGSVSGTAGATGNATSAAAQVEARRQEILQAALAQGGSQAKTVLAGRRKAQANQQLQATQPASATQKPAQAAGQPTASTAKAQTLSASNQPQPTQNTAQAKKVGWEIMLDDKSFAALKRATASQLAKGTNIDVLV